MKLTKKRCIRNIGQERFTNIDEAKERCSNDEQCSGLYNSFYSKDFTLCDAKKELHFSDNGFVLHKTGITAYISFF